ncbi:unnamed protein product [Phaedon cochleariae]|uniref:tRNA-binding domain-containing protein n=1 Tax=Phaedon cochleariae TaxID=80249 RepID=A0A9P0GS80_PHACE|nr:unnamed protein product [Phaedon cochleariae]
MILLHTLNIFRNLKYLRMTGKAAIERIKENAEVAKNTINELKNEMNVLNNEYNTILAQQLREENAQLLAAVEAAKNKLVQLELQKGIKQTPLPNQTILQSSVIEPPAPALSTATHTTPDSSAKPKKDKKPKPPKEKEAAAVELPVNIGRLDLRIGKVEAVQRHPDADALYVLKIDCGEGKPRTVCSGLVKYVPIDELRDRTVIVLCNLKPVKMRGITSEAMVMCASSDAGVEVLTPPSDSLPGDLVHCEGYTRQPDSIMNPKKKIFETVAPDLHTNNELQACYKNVPFNVAGKGFCTAKSLRNVPVK